MQPPVSTCTGSHPRRVTTRRDAAAGVYMYGQPCCSSPSLFACSTATIECFPTGRGDDRSSPTHARHISSPTQPTRSNYTMSAAVAKKQRVAAEVGTGVRGRTSTREGRARLRCGRRGGTFGESASASQPPRPRARHPRPVAPPTLPRAPRAPPAPRRRRAPPHAALGPPDRRAPNLRRPRRSASSSSRPSRSTRATPTRSRTRSRTPCSTRASRRTPTPRSRARRRRRTTW